ncbi:hypothetical protein [Micromonospora sp. NPDC049359]|uniref:hypothetical protein n=1 Tax=Micromonospora sp. NPDC049359 TaxID=3364270 RepID=UPI00379B4571
MSEVEAVGTWVGLITGVFGVALSIVTIWFALTTDRRSKEVSDQTIRSLQKIESAVERSSSDTQSLIKVAWDRLLEGPSRFVSHSAEPRSTQALETANSGLSAEIQAELEDLKKATNDGGAAEQIAQLTASIEALHLQLSKREEEDRRTPSSRTTPNEQIDYLLSTLAQLDPRGLELFRIIANTSRHLTREQYVALADKKSDIAFAIFDLRESRLLVPLKGAKDEPVYYLHPNISRVARTALKLTSERHPEIAETLWSSLRAVGYMPRERP